MQRPRVHILLSTWNGALFVEAQIESLLAQRYPNLLIHIRDDGSSDDTPRRLEAIRESHPSLRLECGPNLGVVGSFLALLAAAGGEPGDYYAFCDQDDLWHPEKVKRAVEWLEACSDPFRTLYCSRLALVDEALQPLGLTPIPTEVGFANAVVENSAIGCTQVFGSAIREALLKAPAEGMIMHDWWAYLTAAALGEVLYDPWPSIRYRRHGATCTPFQGPFARLLSRAHGHLCKLRRQQRGLDSINQAIRFIESTPDVPAPRRKLVRELQRLRSSGGPLERLRWLHRAGIRRTRPLENLALKLMVMSGNH